MEKALHTILETWTNGGWVMGALALVALIAYTMAFQLLLSLYQRGLTRFTDADIAKWVANPAAAPANLRELIRYTQDGVKNLREIEGRFREVESARIPEVDRRIAVVNTLVVSAPLFGLLGTVLGMLITFRAIGVGGSNTSQVIADGISEALVATQTGMMVAIPGMMMAHVAKRWRNEFVAFLLRIESLTLRHFRQYFHGMTRQFTKSSFKKPLPGLAKPQQPLPSP
jgi:biopolymer transport protein ExbB